MLTQYASQLHYRCCFDLATENKTATWSDHIKMIREWISKRCGTQEALGRRWFFTGGEWRRGRFRVQTASCTGNGLENAPQHWAIRYEHPCDDIQLRQWQTDIGLMAVAPNRYRFTLTTTHAIKPGYIGDDPAAPVPSAPGIVISLLRSRRWSAFVGQDTLASLPLPLNAGEGQHFVDRLKTTERLPIILISLHFGSQRPKLDPKQLAQVLAGTAIIYAATSSEVDKELEWLLLKDLRCWNGMIRVYQPSVLLDHEGDGHRHRFFTATDIDERTPAVIQEMLVRGIVRRGRLLGESIASIEDVLFRQRELRLAQLKAKSEGQPSAEWVTVLETDNGALNAKVSQVTHQNFTLEEANAELADRIATLEYEKQSLKAHLGWVGVRGQSGTESDSELLQACRAALEGQPDLTEALTIVRALYSDRIVVLDSAWRAAKDAHLFQEKKRAFELMLKLATDYWSRLDSGGGNAKARQVFGDAFAAKESETVENNSQARKLRTFEYNGQEVEMMSHLRIGIKPSIAKTWRLHFHWDADARCIVIGHCGRHLDHD